MAAASTQPSWLLVLQAVSYSVGALTFLVTLSTLLIGGFRFRANAYVDQHGTVVVELANTGRLAGYISECHLVHRHRFRRRSRRYEQIATAGRLKIGDPALLIPAAGSERLTFDHGVEESWRKEARVLLRFGHNRRRVLKLRTIQGVFVVAPEGDQG
jgi:hypothetical protein